MTMLLWLYGLLVLMLLAYGLNNAVMIAFFWRTYDKEVSRQEAVMDRYKGRADWPQVTVQVPIFNESNVGARIVDALVALDYPRERLCVQLLDDSTDETTEVLQLKVDALKDEGFNIELIHREDRRGFKAGALAEAQGAIQGDYLVMFDADFVPEKDFIKKALPFLMEDEALGFVQARWGHLNRGESWLTRVQAMGIDGHFMVEQSARCWNGLYLNFNGTAGIWRVKAIEAAGGWSWETLTEDMDLSYRVQLCGWRTEYLPKVVAPAEIPSTVPAFKNQQFRWAKGSIQCALKILPMVWAKEGMGWRFVEAFFHMTHYAIHPLMVAMAILSWPVLGWSQILGPWGSFGVFSALLFSMFSTNLLYILSQIKAGTMSPQRGLELPMLMVLGVGVAINNSKAVLEALIGRPSEFVRTPKKGQLKKGETERRQYRSKVSTWVWLELILGLYCGSLLVHRLSSLHWLSPFVLVYTLGFLVVGLSSIKFFEFNRLSWRS